MDFERLAADAVARALRVAPAEVRAAVEEDFVAGETLTALIELLEQVPDLIDVAAVDALEVALNELPDGAHRRIGFRAVAKFRDLRGRDGLRREL